jgi:hypothetical protein
MNNGTCLDVPLTLRLFVNSTVLVIQKDDQEPASERREEHYFVPLSKLMISGVNEFHHGQS